MFLMGSPFILHIQGDLCLSAVLTAGQRYFMTSLWAISTVTPFSWRSSPKHLLFILHLQNCLFVHYCATPLLLLLKRNSLLFPRLFLHCLMVFLNSTWSFHVQAVSFNFMGPAALLNKHIPSSIILIENGRDLLVILLQLWLSNQFSTESMFPHLGHVSSTHL